MPKAYGPTYVIEPRGLYAADIHIGFSHLTDAQAAHLIAEMRRIDPTTTSATADVRERIAGIERAAAVKVESISDRARRVHKEIEGHPSTGALPPSHARPGDAGHANDRMRDAGWTLLPGGGAVHAVHGLGYVINPDGVGFTLKVENLDGPPSPVYLRGWDPNTAGEQWCTSKLEAFTLATLIMSERKNQMSQTKR